MSGPQPTASGPARGAVVLAAALVLAQSVALYLPDTSGVPGTDLPIPHLDKIVHVGLFALPTWALLRVVRRRRVVVGAMLAQAVVSEVVQGTLLPHRGFEVLDAVADLAGIGLGLALAGLPFAGAPGAPRPSEHP